MNQLEKYSTVIWDWNGTLLNDAWLCVEIVNSFLSSHGRQKLDLDSYKDVFGFPISTYYQKIGIDFERESFENLTSRFISSYQAQVTSCGLHEKVLDTLQLFSSNNKKQYILTAAHKESVLPLLLNYSIREFFVEIEGLDNHRAESKLERGRHLIRNNQIDVAKAVLIGDTVHDYDVAKALGVDCILIAAGHQSFSRLDKGSSKDTIVCRSMEDLQHAG